MSSNLAVGFMKLLFVCSANLNRSPTFEMWFKKHTKYEVRSAGIYYGHPYQISIDKKEETLEWADKIFLMDIEHYRYFRQTYPQYMNKVKVLSVGDVYDRDSPQLRDIIGWMYYTNYFELKE